MHITVRNINDGFDTIVEHFRSSEISVAESRNGNVLKINEPVILTYTRPWERVLFNVGRDANPFFHLFESIWMLSGQNNLSQLTKYVKNFVRYSDDGKTLNGAYGFRWRTALLNAELETYDDQLELLISHLKENPNSRRAVLQMWNTQDDLTKINTSKDVCCNLSVLFYIEDNRLKMTVFNRSNDAIFGMLGANMVHFSVLQEYVSTALNVPMGEYNQITNNLHIYANVWDYSKWYKPDTMWKPKEYNYETVIPYDYPMYWDRKVFDKECESLIDYSGNKMTQPFLKDIVQPAIQVHEHWKISKDKESSIDKCDEIKAEDWRIACKNWLNNRK